VTTADPSPAAAKAAFRREIRIARRARSESDRVKAANRLAPRALPALGDCGTVACYQSMPIEPGTAVLIELLRQRDIRVLLPRVNGTSLEWVELKDSTTFIKSNLGIQEPEGSAISDALSDCDAIVLPALAISRDGIRLGQGGGFYDRALQRVPTFADDGPMRIAVIFDEELLNHLPVEPHDSRVDLVVTPKQALRF
jgi:5-formyltetrahydrofolate cyclo-ligase